MIKLGIRVRDSITGFEGIATGRTEYLFGCVRIFIEPTELKDGKPIEGQWIDEQRLGPSDAKSGGPGPIPPSRDCPR